MCPRICIIEIIRINIRICARIFSDIPLRQEKAHAKRRFVSPFTLGLVADRLAPSGRLLVATDQEHYAEHTLALLREHPGRGAGWDVVLDDRPRWRPTDGFEAKGLRAGRTIHDIRATPARPRQPDVDAGASRHPRLSG